MLAAEPLPNDRASIPREGLGFPGVGLGVAIKATCPLGVPVAAVTLLLTLTGVPCAMPVIDVTGFPFGMAIAPDGRSLLYQTWNQTSMDLYSMRTDSAGGSRPYLTGAVMQGTPAFSPDGRSVALFTGVAPGSEIVVRGYPDPGARVQISTGSGVAPRWSHDGKQLYYLTGFSVLAATIAYGPAGIKVTGRDTVIRRSGIVDGTAAFPSIDLSHDGSKFLATISISGELQLVASPHWIVELREKLAARKK